MSCPSDFDPLRHGDMLKADYLRASVSIDDYNVFEERPRGIISWGRGKYPLVFKYLCSKKSEHLLSGREVNDDIISDLIEKCPEFVTGIFEDLLKELEKK